MGFWKGLLKHYSEQSGSIAKAREDNAKQVRSLLKQPAFSWQYLGHKTIANTKSEARADFKRRLGQLPKGAEVIKL